MEASKLIEVPFDRPSDIERLWGHPQLGASLKEYVRSCIKLLPDVVLLDDMKGPVDLIHSQSRGMVVAQAMSFQVMLFNLNPATIASVVRDYAAKEVSLYQVMCGGDPRMDLYVRCFFVT